MEGESSGMQQAQSQVGQGEDQQQGGQGQDVGAQSKQGQQAPQKDAVNGDDGTEEDLAAVHHQHRLLALGGDLCVLSTSFERKSHRFLSSIRSGSAQFF